MPTFPATLVERRTVAEGTMAFRFDPEGAAHAFRPGQYVRVTLVDPPYADERGSTRSFSIASGPSEPGILVAMRMTGSGFKRGLAELPLGAMASLSGPFGSFALDPDLDRPAALLAGGIGVTPFRSMIHDAIERRSPRALALLYANRTPEEAAFLEELTGWQQRLPNLRVFAVMTQPEKSRERWSGRTGRIDVALLRETLGNLEQLECYVAGPPRFLAGVTAALAAAGVAPEQIHEDEFTGY